MFAVIRTGGKQYKVKSGEVIRVEKLEGAAGDKITISDVLLGGSSVLAEIVRQFRDDKVRIFKKRRRHNYRRNRGHRQYLTEVKITEIKA